MQIRFFYRWAMRISRTICGTVTRYFCGSYNFDVGTKENGGYAVH